jgi:hypothetical protein
VLGPLFLHQTAPVLACCWPPALCRAPLAAVSIPNFGAPCLFLAAHRLRQRLGFGSTSACSAPRSGPPLAAHMSSCADPLECVVCSRSSAFSHPQLAPSGFNLACPISLLRPPLHGTSSALLDPTPTPPRRLPSSSSSTHCCPCRAPASTCSSTRASPTSLGDPTGFSFWSLSTTRPLLTT